MSNTEEEKEKKRCSYSYGDYHCPFNAEEGKEYCIFHLPVGDEKKDEKKFWQHLANYLIVLIDNTDDDKIKSAYDYGKIAKPCIKTAIIKGKKEDYKTYEPEKFFWIFSERDDDLYLKYNEKVKQRVKIRKKWEFIGFNFPQMDDKYNFSNFTFPDVDFRDCYFSSLVNFKEAKCSGKANFGSAQFNGDVYFTDVQFSGKVDFSSVQISGDVDFTDTQFNGTADFISTQIRGLMNFSGAQFSGVASFICAQINGDVHISDVQFSRNLYFVGAKFYGLADFESTHFSGIANFESAQFSRIAVFRNSQFNAKANFIKSRFLKYGDFGNSKFMQEADFTKSIIKFIIFTQCEISSFLRIREIQRMNEIDKKALIEKIKKLTGENEKSEREALEQCLKLVDENIPPIILLRDLRFWENGHLLLEDFDVSKTSFWHTNFYIVRPRIDFMRVIWGDKKTIIDDINSRQEYKDWKDKKSSDEMGIIYEPIEILKDELKVEGIEQCYRQIRLNYEAGGEHPDAGEFYKHEMRARGKRLGKGFLRLLHFFYGLFSKYGESPVRAFVSLLIILGFFSFIYLLI
jgi:uncharacterized protein YjbI with pentapeptide repeats